MADNGPKWQQSGENGLKWLNGWPNMAYTSAYLGGEGQFNTFPSPQVMSLFSQAKVVLFPEMCLCHRNPAWVEGSPLCFFLYYLNVPWFCLPAINLWEHPSEPQPTIIHSCTSQCFDAHFTHNYCSWDSWDDFLWWRSDHWLGVGNQFHWFLCRCDLTTANQLHLAKFCTTRLNLRRGQPTGGCLGRYSKAIWSEPLGAHDPSPEKAYFALFLAHN